MLSTLTQETKEYIVDQYVNKHIGITTIAKNLGRSETFVKYNLRKLGVTLKKVKEGSYRKYTLNQHYFDIIDSQDKAYWLGFLYADACNYEDRNELKLCLNENDANHIEKFKTALGSDQPLVRNAGNIRDNTVQITICNGHLSRTLAKHGCTKVKSFTIRFPALREDLISHFMRGYFDGDGYITGDCTQACFGITTNEQFALEYQNMLIKNCNLNTTKLYTKPEDPSKPNKEQSCCLRYSGVENIKKIRYYIYKDAETYLTRNHSKFKNIPSDEQQPSK